MMSIQNRSGLAWVATLVSVSLLIVGGGAWYVSQNRNVTPFRKDAARFRVLFVV